VIELNAKMGNVKAISWREVTFDDLIMIPAF